MIEDEFIPHDIIGSESNESTATPIQGVCFVCKAPCVTTSWHIKLNSWVYICSQSCLDIKNNQL